MSLSLRKMNIVSADASHVIAAIQGGTKEEQLSQVTAWMSTRTTLVCVTSMCNVRPPINSFRKEGGKARTVLITRAVGIRRYFAAPPQSTVSETVKVKKAIREI